MYGTAIQAALCGGSHEVVRYLMEHNANLDLEGLMIMEVGDAILMFIWQVKDIKMISCGC